MNQKWLFYGIDANKTPFGTILRVYSVHCVLCCRVSIQYSSSTVKYLYLHSRMCVREYWSAYSQSVLSFSVHTACHTVHRQETMRKKMSYLSILLEMNWVKTLRKQGKCVPIMLNSDYNRVTPYMNWTGHEHTRMRLRYI